MDDEDKEIFAKFIEQKESTLIFSDKDRIHLTKLEEFGLIDHLERMDGEYERDECWQIVPEIYIFLEKNKKYLKPYLSK